MKLTRIVAIRHGETAWNAAGRLQGYADIPLNPNGQQQACRMADALAHEDIDHIVSSDLQRAWQTALALQAVTQRAPQPEAGLRERSFGVLEGNTVAQIEAEYPEAARQWQRRDPQFAPAGGESLAQFRQRVLDCVEALAGHHAGGHLALVAHGGVLDILYRHANGLDLQAPRTWTIENASINRFLWTPHAFTLVGWADNAHLDGGGARNEISV